MSLTDDLDVLRDAVDAVLGHLTDGGAVASRYSGAGVSDVDAGCGSGAVAGGSGRVEMADLMAGLAAVGDEVVCAGVLEASELADAATAIFTLVVGEWDARQLFRLDGSRSAPARLARDTGCSEASAGRVVRRAKRLRHHRLVADGLINGDLSLDKTDVLCDAAIPARRHLFEEAEANQVSDAKRLGCDDLKATVAYWASAADDALGRDRSKQLHEGRRFSASRTLGGAVAVEGLLDPVAGTIFVALRPDPWVT